MELKPYQQQVINDLELFLEKVQEKKHVEDAFHNFWLSHPRTPLTPYPGTIIEQYKNNVRNAPHICIKVPTAGGKTFIACNAIKTIFKAFYYEQTKAVVWLVPSITILEQTLKNLKDITHPYRQKINSHFNGRVEVYDKNSLLQGTGFNASSVEESLSIFILSFDSLRAKNKEDRKVYKDNSNLHSFSGLVGDSEEISLMRVIQALNPVVIVDESHNAETDLSVEMLRNLNPCFILDLTATPRKNSNIISFVDAFELKKENMVKLPVIVYNHPDKNEVIASAIQLRKKLQLQAEEEEKKNGKYIRPIVLFQAQPKNATDNTTFEKLKEKLIELKIPSEEIKIKTANINEIKDIDLTSRECKVKYIITVNALKEGWDCPFAYILASLADKSSAVDVEQILGRVLRQPYVKKHESPTLNLSYVLTASARFLDTLDSIVKALNRAGFSGKDFKVAEMESSGENALRSITEVKSNKDDGIEIDVDKIINTIEDVGESTTSKIEKLAIEQHNAFERSIDQMQNTGAIVLPADIEPMVKKYRMKEVFTDQASHIKLPQFYIKGTINIFNEEDRLLDKGDLLEDFSLARADSNISFNHVSSQLYKVDLDETRTDHTPTFVKVDGLIKGHLMQYILDPSRKESRAKNLAGRIVELMPRLPYIKESEVRNFVLRIIQDFKDEQYQDFFAHEYTYSSLIKDKIKELEDEFAEKSFRDFLDTDKIFMKSEYSFPVEIIPGTISKDITKSLYDKEAWMNPWEEQVINEIANLSNITFWTKNDEKRHQFKINGFINHYPDFIIHTKKGKTILLETKGDDRDNSDSERKIRLGKAWERKAGNNFRYFMVFDKKEVEGAHRLNDFLNLIKEM
ncbi:MAG: type restriction protein res subunit [Bacteroidetes bacterium]|jgi:type III restriction enzyme|nr:type restriction protein res subunit [Bacteroidota bacterium]